jgi:hypothetical protein
LSLAGTPGFLEDHPQTECCVECVILNLLFELNKYPTEPPP